MKVNTEISDKTGLPPEPNDSVFISEIDIERFGVKTAKATSVTASSVKNILLFCKENEVDFLIARCKTENLSAVQILEKEGFFLADTLVYYKRSLKKQLETQKAGVNIRQFRENEIEQIVSVSKKAFSGYFGHYHADNHLDRKKCDEVYTSWAERSCRMKAVADEVLIAEKNEMIIGFATLKALDQGEGQVVLNAVSPEAQGKGIYRALMVASLKWGQSKGFENMIYSTQITNTAVQKVWVRIGAEISHSEYTLHKWFC